MPASSPGRSSPPTPSPPSGTSSRSPAPAPPGTSSSPRRRAARDYIRQAREAGHDWDKIGHTLRLSPGRDADQEGASPADAAYTYAAGRPDTEAPWRPRSFAWTCRSCDQHISDHGLIQHPADDEIGHAQDCPRLTAAIAAWDAETAEWEAGQ